MERRFDWQKNLPRIFWLCAVIALTVWALQPGYVVGWDLNVYRAALESLKIGHDPYSDAMAIQRIYHAQGPHPAGTAVPFSYVYSPMTLPLVAFAGKFPMVLVGIVYWGILIAAVAATLFVGWSLVQDSEKRVFALLVPLAVFFPGLLQQDVIFSGNVAYILYGAVLLAAWLGWQRGSWWPFYVTVVAASCFKAPLLSLVVIPVFTARKQWVPAGIASVVGVGLFAMQPHVYPSLFKHYLEAVELQFSFNRDFSSSPAGLAANVLFGKVPYQIVSLVAYALYGIPVFVALLLLRKKFLSGQLSIEQLGPVVLLGTILLNPRIMEYDVAPITIPMALVAWRFFGYGRGVKAAAIGFAILFAIVNTIAAHPFADRTWRPVEGLLLLFLFIAGAWTLFRQSDGRVTGGSAARS